MEDREGERLEEHFVQRINALREDLHALSARLADIEAWRNQVLGARKMSWVFWLLFVLVIEITVALWIAMR